MRYFQVKTMVQERVLQCDELAHRHRHGFGDCLYRITELLLIGSSNAIDRIDSLRETLSGTRLVYTPLLNIADITVLTVRQFAQVKNKS